MRPSYPILFWSYLRIGASAFGGGLAALPVFEAELSARRRWLSPGEVAEAFAASQSVPGVIIVNFAVVSALRISGKRAAALAAFAVVLPAFFIILSLAALVDGQWSNRWVESVLSGLRPAAVALIAASAVRLGLANVRSLPALAAALLAAIILLARALGPVPLIFLGAAAGILAARRRSAARTSA